MFTPDDGITTRLLARWAGTAIPCHADSPLWETPEFRALLKTPAETLAQWSLEALQDAAIDVGFREDELWGTIAFIKGAQHALAFFATYVEEAGDILGATSLADECHVNEQTLRILCPLLDEVRERFSEINKLIFDRYLAEAKESAGV